MSLGIVLGALLLWSSPAFGEGWQTVTAGGLSAQVYVPSTTPEGGRGLLLALHGCGQANTVLRDLGNFEGPAEEFGMVVALPNVPNGGVYMGCWDYYGANHTRTNRHTGPVLDFVEALLDDGSMAIDPVRVGVSGLSSGAGMANVLGCVAPDVFSGVAPVAGPAPGTDTTQITSVGVTADRARQSCRQLAGEHVDSFSRQRAVLVAGTQDYIVAQGYAPLNAEMFAGLYEESSPLTSAPLDVSTLDGHEPRGEGTMWSDDSTQRVAVLLIEGMGHAWPAGSGPGAEASFVAKSGPNLAHLLGWFFSGSDTGPPPVTDDPPDGGGTTPDPVDAGPDATAPPTEDFTLEQPEIVDGCVSVAGQVGSSQSVAAITGTMNGGSGQNDVDINSSGRFIFVECALPTGCQQLVLEVTADDGSVDFYCTEPFEVTGGGGGGVISEATGTLVDHTTRLEYFETGYGVADASYAQLLADHGVLEDFPLFEGSDGHWYVHADNVPGGDLELQAECDVADDQRPVCPGAVVGPVINVDEGCSCRVAGMPSRGSSPWIVLGVIVALGLLWRRKG